MKASYKWICACLYTIGIFIITPYLPQLIQAAASRWSSSGVKLFVLGVEIATAGMILTLAFVIFTFRRKKSAVLLSSLSGIFLLSFIIYQFIPNPYEFTHLPEYAILSMLIVWSLHKGQTRSSSSEKEKKLKPVTIQNPYFLSAIITSIIGTADEIYQHFLPNRYFTVYDIFLNMLGGILGLLIFWGIRKQEYSKDLKV